MLSLPLGGPLTLQLAASRRTDEIDRPTASFDDTVTQAAAALSRQLARHLYLTARVRWTERDSDLVPVSTNPLDYRDYKRTALSAGFQWIW